MSRAADLDEFARNVLENMSEAFSLVGFDFTILDLNSASVALDGRPSGELVGQSLWVIEPDLERTEIGQAIKRVMSSRAPESMRHLHTWSDGRTAWLDIRLLPVRAGLALFYNDVTEEISQSNRLKATTQRLDAILNNTTMAVFVMDNRQHCVFANKAAEKLTGYNFEELQARPLHDVIHHKRPDGSHYPLEECPIDRAFPEQMQTQGQELFVAPDGSLYPVSFTASPLLDDLGEPVGTVIEARNVSEEIAKEETLRLQARSLETINRTGEAIASELDLDRLVHIVTDASVELTGAKYGAFFYNVIDITGEKLLLYALSGASQEDFAKFGMPRATAIFHPTFVGEGLVRSDNIRQDPRYGLSAPHHGMPEGHLTVTSYLAVPVQSRSGEVIGGLFLGHPDAGRFDERHELLLIGVAAQAAIAIDNARLYQSAQQELADRKRAETALLELNETLEDRVKLALSEQRRAEEALRQAQKMEAVGQLTGGIAHDFNNLLTVITGNLDMALRALSAANIQDPRTLRALDNALKGSERAASLTQRLLAFSRRQPLDPKPLDVDKLVGGMSDLLNRALGERVNLEIVTCPGLWKVEADPNQLESAILNLAVNARDAMPNGGGLVIETANARLEEEYCASHAEVAPGQYVVIAVTDMGDGMPHHIQERVFEPFFTTKEPGKGTGLGLSMVYGFVKQSGGHIKIYSEEGQGTTIKLYLPRLMRDAALKGQGKQTTALEASTGSETILVVEDDDEVRAYTIECLRELGYCILEAHDGPSALRILERSKRMPHLLFTDVVMPGMTGKELVDAARAIHPDLKVLYTSGYTRNAIVHGGRLDSGVEMIPKPFTYAALATKIRDVLEAGRIGRVLVVEEEPTVRSLAMELLIGSGYSVEEAGTAQEALSKLRAAQGRYDVMFVAQQLPETTGAWLCGEIRKLHADLPVLIAARPEDLQRLTLLIDRCTGIIEKPYTGEKLMEALHLLGVRCK